MKRRKYQKAPTRREMSLGIGTKFAAQRFPPPVASLAKPQPPKRKGGKGGGS
jgi:hypothetical protein